MADTRGTWSRRGEAGWRRLLESYSRSGLTVAEFCQQAGCCTASLYQWRRRLGDDLGTPAVEASQGNTGFLDLGPLAALGGKRSGIKINLTLEFGNGLKLHLVRT